MFVAITSGSEVLEIASSERSSLEGLQAYANLGYRGLRRIQTSATVYVAFGHRQLRTDIEVIHGKAKTIFIDARTLEKIRKKTSG